MNKENIVRYSADEIRRMVERGETKTDWARIDAMTEEEIRKLRKDDPDWVDHGEFDWSKAVAVHPIPKDAISIRLDKDVIDFFKAGGKGYQTRINAVLRHYMQAVAKAKKLAE